MRERLLYSPSYTITIWFQFGLSTAVAGMVMVCLMSCGNPNQGSGAKPTKLKHEAEHGTSTVTPVTEQASSKDNTKILTPQQMDALFKTSQKVFARLENIGFEKMTIAEQTFLCVWHLDGEVNNGGFDQFFWNSSGDYANETPSALDKIGAAKTADIVRRANKLFNNSSPSKNRASRQNELDVVRNLPGQMLGALDDEFYKRPDNLEKLLYTFWTEHHNDFLDP